MSSDERRDRPRDGGIADPPLSTRLHWTAECFRFGGYLGGFVVFAGAVATLAGVATMRTALASNPEMYVGGMLAGGVTALAWWITGEALRARKRVGAWFALGSLVPPLAHAALTGGRPSVSLAVSAIGALAVLSSWRELD